MAEKRINPFTLEEEDVPEPLLAPSPTDQRILAAPPHKDPLPDLVARVINGAGSDSKIDLEAHEGPSLQGPDPLPGETPVATVPDLDGEPVVLNDSVETQHEDVPSANEEYAKSIGDASPETYGPYRGQKVDEEGNGELIAGPTVDVVEAAEEPTPEPEPATETKPKATTRKAKAKS